jgi:hypothetical protein
MKRIVTVCHHRGWGAWIRTLSAVCLLAAASAPAAGEDRTAAAVNCDIQKGPCEQIVADTKVLLEILPRPVQAMRELTFRVTVADYRKFSAAPFIDLNMPAMDMGVNQVPLKDLGQGIFEGQGVIVRCRSGHKTWRARVTLPDLGEADFIFNVVY